MRLGVKVDHAVPGQSIGNIFGQGDNLIWLLFGNSSLLISNRNITFNVISLAIHLRKIVVLASQAELSLLLQLLIVAMIIIAVVIYLLRRNRIN